MSAVGISHLDWLRLPTTDVLGLFIYISLNISSVQIHHLLHSHPPPPIPCHVLPIDLSMARSPHRNQVLCRRPPRHKGHPCLCKSKQGGLHARSSSTLEGTLISFVPRRHSSPNVCHRWWICRASKPFFPTLPTSQRPITATSANSASAQRVRAPAPSVPTSTSLLRCHNSLAAAPRSRNSLSASSNPSTTPSSLSLPISTS